ncbi:FUSC family protein [Methylobacterium oryzae CBMB20]
MPTRGRNPAPSLVGALLAGVVGLTLRYTLLTTTGSFALLAAVLLPVAMLAVVGRADKRAIYGIGFGFFVFGVLDPKNPMTYDLADSLNTVLAELLGMAVAAIAFAALPPPVSAATLRLRARRRLVRSVRGAALDPAPPAAAPRPLPRPGLRPARPHRRGCRRGPERRAPARHRAPAARPAGDGRPGGPPSAGRSRRGSPRPDRQGRRRRRIPCADLADRATLPLQADRIGALAALVSDLDRAGWPNLDPGVRA